MERAARGDDSCYPQVRALLEDGERGLRWTITMGSMANCVRVKLIDKISDNNILVQETFMENLNHLCRGLAGPDPSPIETVLAEAASINWLVYYRYERLTLTPHLTIPQADLLRRQVDSAHKRFITSLVALAKVRHLALPELRLNQINIAEQQVTFPREDTPQ
jgi:hypothetical protein